MLRAALVTSWVGVILVGGCANPANDAMIPEPDRAAFDSEVFPILASDCSFPQCHGSADRFLRIYSPARSRLDPATPRSDALTTEESDANFDRVRAFLFHVEAPSQCLLLRKPLSIAAGGEAHQGIDGNGRSIYANKQDPHYVVLEDWVRDALRAP